MAWQLIFTSIPRGLQPGRSGYCTAARHKEIRERLVHEIERVSQYDSGQHQGAPPIIYTYRILAAGSANFYLLTRIVDAGADYTGRTNYLAHHLVFTEAEVENCPFTPAEILYNFPWRDAWNEKEARYFEEQELVAASNPFWGVAVEPFRLPPVRWGRLSGDGACAALLYAPDSGEPANVILLAPKADSKQRDLLPLFGESLRILEPTVEQTSVRWTVPFTTHLQSTDSLTDFQWIGVSPDSPRLKAPGKRVVIDLTQPNCADRYSDRLLSVRHLEEKALAQIAAKNEPASDHFPDAQESIPAPVGTNEANPPDSVVAAQAAIAQATSLPTYESETTTPPSSAIDSGAVNADVQKGVPTLEPQPPRQERESAVSQSSEQKTPHSFKPLRSAPEPQLTKEPLSTTLPDRGRSKRIRLPQLLAILAAAVVLLGGAGGAFFYYQKTSHRKDVCAEIDAILTRSGYFTDAFRAELRKAEPVELGKELAVAAEHSFRVAEKAEFEAMRDLPDTALSDRAKKEHVNIGEISDLDDRLHKIAGVYQSLLNIQPQDDKASEQIQSQSDQAHNLTANNKHFNKINEAIDALVKEQQAAVSHTQSRKRINENLSVLSNIIKTGPTPDQTTAWLEGKLDSITPPAEVEGAGEIITEAQQLLKNWKLVEKQQPTPADLAEIDVLCLKRSKVPEWLKIKAQKMIETIRVFPPNRPGPVVVTPTTNVPPTTVIPVITRLVVYFFKNNADLKYQLRLDAGPVKILLRFFGKKEEEVRPNGLNSETYGIDGVPYFVLKDGILTQAKMVPIPPYRLTVKRGDAEMDRIYVGLPSREEGLLENTDIALTLSPDGQIGGTLPEFAPSAELSYLLGYYDANQRLATLEVIDRKCQLQPIKNRLNKAIQEKNSELTSLQAKANSLAQAAPDAKNVGRSAESVANRFDQVDPKEPKGKPHPLQKLRQAGASLAGAASDIEKTKSAEVLHSLLGELMNGPYNNEKLPEREALNNLKTASFHFKTDLAKNANETKAINERAAAVRREVDGLRKSPWFNKLAGAFTLYIKPHTSNESINEMIKVQTLIVPASNP